ncbi:BICC1 [Lepeophtheirus salmonis]|uniref:BICC1 n=1 Tax=Lepeophtheirus salmonis TaxID=72036 RepID=A0A7R8CH64_LEPSM|nr:BICC1 [Lepeophtheirus salmonis]CAF2816506.1 BICC1 [Lepeophtheirus salmonis]
MLIAANAASAAAQLQQKQSLHTSRSSISGWTPTSAKNSLSNGVSGMSSGGALDPQSQSKYHQLLSVIEEMSKDIRPTYAGSKSSAERLKRGIIFARILSSLLGATRENEWEWVSEQVVGSTSHSLSRESSRDDLVSISQDQIFEYEERFRVDRRKLELMIIQKLEHIEVPAADFFNRIEYETNTTIIWPSRLKIGAKSKKDPHIRVGGCEKFVKEAKCLIMEFLDNKTNRVVIQFEDNPNEKSNQVSIAGEVEGVERARARVRELTPLVFNFDLPVIPSLQSTPDPLDPYLRAIQDQYNIQVMFRQKQKNFHTTTVVVKGCEWEGSRVKEATLLLIDHLCQTSLNVPVAMNMEISPQHHSIVLGKGNMTLKVIMQRTNTTILFPDAGDPNIPPIRKGSVTITGAIHNVYLARQQLMGSLPLVMMFDLPESLSIDDSFIRKLQEEKTTNASGIYKSRIDLLNLHDLEAIVAVIPETYKIPCVLGKLDCVDPISLPINHRSSLMIFS